MYSSYFPYYHAHIYFDADTLVQAKQLHEKAARDLSDVNYLGRMHLIPIGPHPKPMFEVNFHAELLPKVLPWLMQNHGNLSVLLHPLSGNAMDDHTLYPAWLGQPLPLYLDDLRS